MNHPSIYRRWCLIAVLMTGALGVMSAEPVLAQPPAVMNGPAATGEMKPVAVVVGASYDEMISDLAFLGSLGGQPEVSQMVEGGIALFTQGKGLASIDRTKPWGVILQTDGLQFLPVGCLPVTQLDDLLQVAENYGCKIQDSGGVKEISLPNGRSAYVAAEGNWAFVAQSAASLAYLPDDPQSTLTQLVDDYDVAVMFSVQNIPEMYRQMALQAFQAGLAEGLQRQQGSDEQRELQRQISDMQKQQIVRLIEEVDSLTLGWAVDATEQRTYLDFVYRFLPDSAMAKQLAACGQPQTNFAGFYQPGAAVTMTFVNKGDPELMQADVQQFKTMMANVRQQLNNAIDQEQSIPDDETRAALKEAAGDLLDVAQATVESGQIDGGAALQLSPDSMTLVAGMLVQQPDKIDEALKKLASAAKKDPQFPGIQWNAASHGGVSFHTLRVPVPAHEEQVRALLGEQTELAIGIGPAAVYFAMGRDWLSAVNQAIDASAAEPNKAVPPFELSMSLGQIMKMAATYADEDDRPKAQMIADMLQDDAQGRDHLRMVGQIIPNGLRYRFEAEEGVLRAVGKAAAQAQQAAMQQQ